MYCVLEQPTAVLFGHLKLVVCPSASCTKLISKLVVYLAKVVPAESSVLAHLNLVLGCIISCLNSLALAGVEEGYLAV